MYLNFEVFVFRCLFSKKIKLKNGVMRVAKM